MVEDEEQRRVRFPRSRYMRRYSLLFATVRKTPRGLLSLHCASASLLFLLSGLAALTLGLTRDSSCIRRD